MARKESLFFKILPYYGYCHLILVFQTSVVSIIYKIQAKLAKMKFSPLRNNLQSLFNDVGTVVFASIDQLYGGDDQFQL